MLSAKSYPVFNRRMPRLCSSNVVSNSMTANSKGLTQTVNPRAPAKSKIAIDVKLTNKRTGMDVQTLALIDTGSVFNILPAKLVSPDMLLPVNHTIHGIAGEPVHASGYVECRIDFGNGFVPNATFIVVPTDVPVLLGMQFLSSEARMNE